MSIYLDRAPAISRSTLDLLRPSSMRSLDQENINTSSGSIHKVLDRCDLLALPELAHLRVKNKNIPRGSSTPIETERRGGTQSPRSSIGRKSRLSWRSLSNSEVTPRLSLPPPDDPIITKALENSLGKKRSGSLLSADLQDSRSGTNAPFRRWIKTINRNAKGRRAVQPREERWSLDEFDDDLPSSEAKETPSSHIKHRKSISWASGSSAFVTVLRSARQSLSTFSETSSRRDRGSGFTWSSTRGGRHSRSLNRSSADDAMHPTRFLDESSWDRSVKRSQVLEELVQSEESYLSDLKALLNVSSNEVLNGVRSSFNSGIQYFTRIRTRAFEKQHFADPGHSERNSVSPWRDS